MAYKYKRSGSPFWYISYYDPLTGKKGKPISTKTKNAKLADAKVKEIEDKVELKRLTKIRLKNSDIKLSEAVEIYIIDRKNSLYNYNKHTVKTYDNALKYLYRTCGDKAVSKYDRSDYYKFLTEMESLGHNTKSKYSEKVYSIFRFLVNEKYIYENPFKRINPVYRDFNIISDSEMKKLRDYASHTKFKDLIDFLIISAFRINEALHIRTTDISDKMIIIKEAKMNKTRSIPLTNEMQNWLKYYYDKKNINKDDDVRLFTFTEDNVFRFWQRCRATTGLRRDITSHSLRKYTLSNMANNEVNLNFIKEYAGHESIKTTLKYYVKNDPDKMAAELNKKIKFIK